MHNSKMWVSLPPEEASNKPDKHNWAANVSTAEILATLAISTLANELKQQFTLLSEC